MHKIVFVSSTFDDLREHRRAVWQVLEELQVSVKGMEQFGARTENALDTCLAEVAQAEVFVGILGFRLGSLDTQSGKSFTQLEYERAKALEKDVLIYIADEATHLVTIRDIDVDSTSREQLDAFKRHLREQHTIGKFASARDLAETIRRDFRRYLSPKTVTETSDQAATEFEEASVLAGRFLLQPAVHSGREIRIRARFTATPFPASKALCEAFNLQYGAAVGQPVQIERPQDQNLSVFTVLFAPGDRVDELLALASQGVADVYTRLEFRPQDVEHLSAYLFGYSEPIHVVVPKKRQSKSVAPEGRAILLFSKSPLCQ